jgi:K+-sensing histidine kinase KdpD
MNDISPTDMARADTWRIENSIIAGIAGPVAALAVAGALVGQRETLGIANVGFVILLIVLIASLVGGRPAGLATAVVGALGFNFFHTQPYQSFAVAAREDVISVILCGIAGIGIGEVGARLHRRSDELAHARAANKIATRLITEIGEHRSVAATWATGRALIADRVGAQVTYRDASSGASTGITAMPVVHDGATAGHVELSMPTAVASPYLEILAAALSAAARADPTGLTHLR